MGANYETYNKLHDAMKIKGFSRKIIFGDVSYWLPNAGYTITIASTIAQIKQDAISAAKSVWSDFGVLVTQSE